jgi:hypothetical protein
MLLTHDQITRLTPAERLALIAQLWDRPRGLSGAIDAGTTDRA